MGQAHRRALMNSRERMLAVLNHEVPDPFLPALRGDTLAAIRQGW